MLIIINFKKISVILIFSSTIIICLSSLFILKDGFKKAGVDLFFGNQPANISNNNCFSTSTLADLVDKNNNNVTTII
mgnify:CR=1 FL=1